MKLYYQQGSIVIYHGDWREFVDAGCADAIVTDPPYGDTSLEWDVFDPDWLARALVWLRPGGSAWVFGSMRMFLRLAGHLDGWRLAQDIVWEKHNGSGFHADRFKRVHELALQLYPASVPWSEIYKKPQFTMDATKRTVRRKERPPHTGDIAGSRYASQDGGPRLMRSVFRAPSCHGHAEHPTQKPESVVRPLIEFSCPPPGTVLDPFVGSGTTLVAAKSIGRAAIGIDIDERFCEMAARRLAQETLPGVM